MYVVTKRSNIKDFGQQLKTVVKAPAKKKRIAQNK